MLERLVAVAFPATDLDGSRVVYEAAVGRSPDEAGDGWVAWDLDGVQVVLSAWLPVAGGPQVHCQVGDASAAWSDLVAVGAGEVAEPSAGTAAVADPNGNVLWLMEEPCSP